MTPRPFKFRAWNPVTKEMLHVSDLQWSEKRGLVRLVGHLPGSVPLKDGWYDLHDGEQHQVTLMQFTGLHDKNGKEIWEGDVVLACETRPNGELVDLNAPPIPRAVKFSTEHCGFIPFAEYDSDCGVGTYGQHSEVIGNIYENPELLTQSQ